MHSEVPKAWDAEPLVCAAGAIVGEKHYPLITARVAPAHPCPIAHGPLVAVVVFKVGFCLAVLRSRLAEVWGVFVVLVPLLVVEGHSITSSCCF